MQQVVSPPCYNLHQSHIFFFRSMVTARDIKKSKFIAIAGHISNEPSAQSFIAEVGNQYPINDDGEPSSTAGKPIHSAIENSGLDRVMVVVIRHFGGIKLGTGGLVRAYGVATECLKSAPKWLVKSQVTVIQSQGYKAGLRYWTRWLNNGLLQISFYQAEALEEALKTNCSRNLVFYKH